MERLNLYLTNDCNKIILSTEISMIGHEKSQFQSPLIMRLVTYSSFCYFYVQSDLARSRDIFFSFQNVRLNIDRLKNIQTFNNNLVYRFIIESYLCSLPIIVIFRLDSVVISRNIENIN